MLRRIIRPMIAAVYIADGVKAVKDPGPLEAGTKDVIDNAKALLPDQYASFIPEDPALVARAAGAIRIAAGSSLALGKLPRLSGATLAAVSIPTILARNAFWKSEDPQEKESRRNGLLTNVALLGGLLLTSADTAGKPSLGWRAQRASMKAQKKFAALTDKTPSAAESFASTVQDNFEQAQTAVAAALPSRDEALKTASEVGSKAKSFFDDAKGKVLDFVEDAADFVEDNRDEWAKELNSRAKTAQKAVSGFAATTTDRASELTSQAEDFAAQFSKQTETWMDKARKNVDVADTRIFEIAEDARARAKDAFVEARDAAADAADRGSLAAKSWARRAETDAYRYEKKARKAAARAEKRLGKRLDKLDFLTELRK
ncbi:MAG: DoxX family protein [Corynebacterium sp.]|nr:DoxX family protein [Corynebacterium sp.]